MQRFEHAKKKRSSEVTVLGMNFDISTRMAPLWRDFNNVGKVH
jgi:hypothetical protein